MAWFVSIFLVVSLSKREQSIAASNGVAKGTGRRKGISPHDRITAVDGLHVSGIELIYLCVIFGTQLWLCGAELTQHLGRVAAREA